jgi:hypothetical protein
VTKVRSPRLAGDQTVGMRITRTTAVGVGVVVLAGLIGPSVPARATTGGAACGAPDQAPGFGSPARPGRMPQVRCMDLQLARDKAKVAGFHEITWEDAAGRRRQPIEYRNWVVVDQTPPAGTAGSSRSPVRFRVLAYGDRGAPPVPDRSRPGRVPALVCFNLWESEATLASAGFGDVVSEDATGRGRHQIIRRHWTVTGQTPPPGGTYAKSTRVTLRVVQQSERPAC